MTTSEIHGGICGFGTRVEARMEGAGCALKIDSDCPAVQRLAEKLISVDPFREISFRGQPPQTMELAAQICSHAACPVPVGIIKTVEVEAGLALPADVSIKVSK